MNRRELLKAAIALPLLGVTACSEATPAQVKEPEKRPISPWIWSVGGDNIDVVSFVDYRGDERVGGDDVFLKGNSLVELKLMHDGGWWYSWTQTFSSDYTPEMDERYPGMEYVNPENHCMRRPVLRLIDPLGFNSIIRLSGQDEYNDEAVEYAFNTSPNVNYLASKVSYCMCGADLNDPMITALEKDPIGRMFVSRARQLRVFRSELARVQRHHRKEEFEKAITSPEVIPFRLIPQTKVSS